MSLHTFIRKIWDDLSYSYEMERLRMKTKIKVIHTINFMQLFHDAERFNSNLQSLIYCFQREVPSATHTDQTC